MKPSTEEILRGIKQNFDGVILPEITAPWPRSVAHTISYLLAHLIVRAAKEGRFAVEESRELAEVLQGVNAALTRLPEPSQSPALAAIAIAAAQLLAESDRQLDPDQLAAWNLAARELLVRVTLATAGEAEALAPVQPLLDRYLTAQLDRDLALTEPIRTKPFPPKGVVME